MYSRSMTRPTPTPSDGTLPRRWVVSLVDGPKFHLSMSIWDDQHLRLLLQPSSSSSSSSASSSSSSNVASITATSITPPQKDTLLDCYLRDDWSRTHVKTGEIGCFSVSAFISSIYPLIGSHLPTHNHPLTHTQPTNQPPPPPTDTHTKRQRGSPRRRTKRGLHPDCG